MQVTKDEKHMEADKLDEEEVLDAATNIPRTEGESENV